MSFWNAPVSGKESRSKAVQSALGMVERLKDLNDELESEDSCLSTLVLALTQ